MDEKKFRAKLATILMTLDTHKPGHYQAMHEAILANDEARAADELGQYMAAHVMGEGIKEAIDFMSRYPGWLERIGDHATETAGQVIDSIDLGDLDD
jgi:hypothetical protein